MDKQSTHQKNPAAPARSHPTKTSVKSPVHQEEEMQGAIGNRQMGLLMETHPHIHPSSLNATMVGEMPMLGGMMPVSQGRIQRQPLFGGLSQEMRLENATLALPATGALVQRKLTLGTPGDMYEEEADRVARQVVDEIHSSPFRVQNAQSEEERIPAGGEAGRVQRQITVRSAGDAGGELSSEWEGELHRAKSGGQPLSQSVKEPMERAFGADFGGVRVHTGAQADMLARSIQAKAFTTGQDVFFRQGAYEQGSRGGQELIAHELTHVVQKGRGKKKGARHREGQKGEKQPETMSNEERITGGSNGTIMREIYINGQKKDKIPTLKIRQRFLSSTPTINKNNNNNLLLGINLPRSHKLQYMLNSPVRYYFETWEDAQKYADQLDITIIQNAEKAAAEDQNELLITTANIKTQALIIEFKEIIKSIIVLDPFMEKEIKRTLAFDIFGLGSGVIGTALSVIGLAVPPVAYAAFGFTVIGFITQAFANHYSAEQREKVYSREYGNRDSEIQRQRNVPMYTAIGATLIDTYGTFVSTAGPLINGLGIGVGLTGVGQGAYGLSKTIKYKREMEQKRKAMYQALDGETRTDRLKKLECFTKLQEQIKQIIKHIETLANISGMVLDNGELLGQVTPNTEEIKAAHNQYSKLQQKLNTLKLAIQVSSQTRRTKQLLPINWEGINMRDREQANNTTLNPLNTTTLP